MFPIETNPEKPSRCRALLEQCQSEGARLRRETDPPGRQRSWRKGRVQVRLRRGDAEAVRPEQPRAVRADERKQLLLPLASLGAGLGEAGRDHAERAHALAQRLVGRLQHPRPGQADDRQLDLVRDPRDRVVPAHSRDRLAAAVDRVRRAVEVRLEHIAEELAADRAAPARGADHGDRARLEEGAQRGGHGDVVAFLDACLKCLGRRDRKADLHFAVLELAHDVEARPGEDAQHGAVLSKHFGDEARHAGAGRAVGQLLEQARADPAALLLVGDRERDLSRSQGRAAARSSRRPRPGRRATPRARRSRPSRVRAATRPAVARRSGSRGSAGRGCAPTGPRRMRAARPHQPRRGTQPERAAVLEDDVGSSGCAALDAKRQPPLLHGRAARSTPAGLRARL